MRFLPLLLLVGCSMLVTVKPCDPPPVEKYTASVVKIVGLGGQAAGVIVRQDSTYIYVASCDHVAAMVPHPVVYVGDRKRAISGEWIARDAKHDLAIMRVPYVLKASVAELGTRADCKPGAPVLSFGYPHVGDLHWNRGEIIGPASAGLPDGLIVNTWAVGGYSGGPVFNTKTGRLVGLVSRHAMGRIPGSPHVGPLPHIVACVPVWRIREMLK